MEKLYSRYRKWQKDTIPEKDGIIVASDITQEWLLPWWWDHYSKHNKLPVAFVDFGMSEEMKTWCKQRGQFINLPIADNFFTYKGSIPDSVLQNLETFHIALLKNRNAWFKKPLACLQSPFFRSIWIDIDCEIRGSLDKLFDYCENPSSLAIAKNQGDPESASGKDSYNSGVIVFKQGIEVFEKWAEESIDNNYNYFGDEDVLTKLIHDHKVAVNVLSNHYNWSHLHKEPPDVIIYHFLAQSGKNAISSAIVKNNSHFWR